MFYGRQFHSSVALGPQTQPERLLKFLCLFRAKTRKSIKTCWVAAFGTIPLPNAKKNRCQFFDNDFFLTKASILSYRLLYTFKIFWEFSCMINVLNIIIIFKFINKFLNFNSCIFINCCVSIWNKTNVSRKRFKTFFV